MQAVHSLPSNESPTSFFPSYLISALTPLYLPAGNQARVADKSTVVSTSTRNFPNRLGKGAFVFLASAELASIAAIEGKLPSVDEYQKYASKIKETSADTFRYLNFHRLNEYVEKGKSADLGPEVSKLTSHISAPQQLIINNTIRHRVALSDIWNDFAMNGVAHTIKMRIHLKYQRCISWFAVN